MSDIVGSGKLSIMPRLGWWWGDDSQYNSGWWPNQSARDRYLMRFEILAFVEDPNGAKIYDTWWVPREPAIIVECPYVVEDLFWDVWWPDQGWWDSGQAGMRCHGDAPRAGESSLDYPSTAPLLQGVSTSMTMLIGADDETMRDLISTEVVKETDGAMVMSGSAIVEGTNPFVYGWYPTYGWWPQRLGWWWNGEPFVYQQDKDF